MSTYTYNDPLETFWDAEQKHSEFRWGERVLIGTPEDVGACADDIENMREEIGSLRGSLRKAHAALRILSQGHHAVCKCCSCVALSPSLEPKEG